MPNEKFLKLKLTTENAQYTKGLNDAENRLMGFQNKVKSVSSVMGGLFAGFTAYAVVDQLKNAYIAAEEVEKVNRKLEAVLKSTGYAAGLSSYAIDAMASSLMELTGIDDEVIKSAQTVLLTFTNVGKDVFPQATQAALDMSAVMGQDLQSSIVQIGKALNDPIQGVSALRRVGVQLTDQQKAQIAIFLKNNDILSAQKVILAELQKEFGGAAAAGKTAGQELSVAIGNFGEQLGSFIQGPGAGFLGWIKETVNNASNLLKVFVLKGELAKLERRDALPAIIAQKEALLAKETIKLEQDILKSDISRLKKEKAELDTFFAYKNTTEKTGLRKPGIENTVKTKQLKPLNQPKLTQSQKGTDSLVRAINEEFFARQNELETVQALSFLGINENNPIFDKFKQIVMDFNSQIRDIELAEVKNKEELKLQIVNLYKQKAMDLEKEWTKAIAEQNREDEIRGVEFTEKAKADVVAHNFKVISDANKENAQRFQELWQHAFNRVFDHSLTWKQKMIGIFTEVLMHQAKMALMKSLTPAAGSIGFWGTLARTGLALAGTFAEGGRPPVGKVSLVGERGAELFVPDTAGTIIPNNKLGDAGRTSHPIMVYNSPTINTGAKKEDVLTALSQSNKELGAMIAKAVKDNAGGARIAVRGA